MKSYKENNENDLIKNSSRVKKPTLYGSIKKSNNARHHPDIPQKESLDPCNK